MTYKGKQSLTRTAAGVATMILYATCAIKGSAPFVGGLSELSDWAKLMLLGIGAGIAIQILSVILFHIVMSAGIAIREGHCDDAQIEREIESSAAEDEMDAQIEYRSTRIGAVCSGIGFVAALVALAANVPTAVALNIAFAALALGSICEGCAQIFFYERGV